ncbi:MULTISPECIES: sulfotransferase domain-containing protein [unclassified Pseudomonas]|uniref:sulfotransferase domain-containing protein n=1 Tax=unclassified Pseudomonas TaxID=196821 RepID=UPI00244AB2E3|nr:MULTISPECIES: sulfotransferase domain-containing protein [unclassified Pseudomonas]MDH0892826.1 sulfotransferase domain-containing protein [Pseudomonas sp. GD03875]MDH1064700.1 sulfotransferase domain-containing protein [Pseudomonas sp. GD03985]
MKVDFLVPGISKCGTTTLCYLLGEHPEIFIPEIKEPNYFVNEDLSEHRPFYEGLFAPAAPGQLLGEGSQLYSTVEFEKLVSTRLREHNSEMKLIFSVRNPLKRIESSYREHHHSGPSYAINTPFGIAAAMTALPALLDDSRYWQRLQNYRRHFRDDQILVVFLEDLQQEPQRVLGQCYEFLGVDSGFVNAVASTTQLNAGEEKLYDTRLLRYLRTHGRTGFKIASIPIPTQDKLFRRLGLRRPFTKPIRWSEEARARVVDTLKADIAELLAYCGRPADFWKEFA